MKNIPIDHLFDLARNARASGDMDFLAMGRMSRFMSGISTIHKTYSYNSSDQKRDRIKIRDWLNERGYVSQTIAMSTVCVLQKEGLDYPVAMVSISTMLGTLNVNVQGDKEEMEEIHNWVEANFKSDGVLVKIATGILENGSIKYDRTFLDLTTSQVANDSFYPWLNISLNEYFRAFLESKETILVLFGPPGVGKSTFLRSLILYCKEQATLAYNKSVVESPILLSSFFKDNSRILAYEDIDNHLGRREDQNKLMPTLLNASEGVVKYPDKKIVFSTNLPSVDRIDKALLRKGRCFDILPFRELDQEEASNVLKSINKEPRDFSSKKTWPLAEVLSEDNIAQQTVNRFGRSIGFIS